MIIPLTGGTTFLGYRLTREFLSQGHTQPYLTGEEHHTLRAYSCFLRIQDGRLSCRTEDLLIITGTVIKRRNLSKTSAKPSKQ